MKSAMFAGSLLVSLLAGVALAQAPAPGATTPTATAGGTDFASFDRNKDGRVSSAEAATSVELNAAFATLDTNHDTYLSAEEFAKWNKGAKAPAK